MRKEARHSLLTWRSWHKWVGMVFSVVIILFCLSGIVLNHRQAFSCCEVSRGWLPDQYQIKDWNQNVVKGTLPIANLQLPITNSFRAGGEAIIAYGQAGVWFTDRQFKSWRPLNDGFTATGLSTGDEGIDNRKISNVVQTQDGTLWCAALFDVYRYDADADVNADFNPNVDKGRWQKVLLPDNDERLSDITLRGGDTIVVATRSVLYEGVAPKYEFKRIQLKAPEGNKPEVTLLKTVWWLHSGQLFGTAGKLVVDFIGVVLIILCVTGIVFFVLGYSHRFRVRILSAHAHARVMHVNLKWHNRLGAYLLVFTILLAVTGMCLRPPLMVPLVLTKTAPLPGSTQDSDNAFEDKIRAIRWDDRLGVWLMSTSEGFFAMNKDLETAVPVAVDGAPQVSPMGITVFERNPYNEAEWLIGSFSGLECWNPVTGEIREWFDDVPPLLSSHRQKSPIPSTNGHLVTGFSKDVSFGPVVFEYSGAPHDKTGCLQANVPQMPEILKQ